jgi:mannitol-1-phosphate/altronate dehydrogenase
LDWAVVAEPFYGIPVEEHALAGFPAVPTAVRPLPPAEFSAAEDVKMMAHNGLHAVLACLGHLRGMTYFDELRDEADLMEIGRRLLVEEAAPALLRKHGPTLPRNECLNYCDSILRRVTCPVLHDPIERGTRGIMRKLQPWERLVYSVRTIAKQGVVPEAYATGLAAAVVVARRTGETEMEFDRVLTDHCGLEPARDDELLELVGRCRERFED